jgi:hypothetical protein
MIARQKFEAPRRATHQEIPSRYLSPILDRLSTATLVQLRRMTHLDSVAGAGGQPAMPIILSSDQFFGISFLVVRNPATLGGFDGLAIGGDKGGAQYWTRFVRQMMSRRRAWIRARRPDRGSRRKNVLGGSVQVLEKAQFGQENPRKSKLFSLISFARAWPDFAGFG